MKDLFRVSLRAAIIKEDKILLVNERNEKIWETPGGGINHGETIGDGLKREILEETGLDIDIKKILYAFNRGDFIHVIFLTDSKNKIQEPTEEKTLVKWFTKDEIKSLLDKNEADDHDIKLFKMFVNEELK